VQYDSFSSANDYYDATALRRGVAGWLRGEWKVGIHDLLGSLISLLAGSTTEEDDKQLDEI